MRGRGGGALQGLPHACSQPAGRGSSATPRDTGTSHCELACPGSAVLQAGLCAQWQLVLVHGEGAGFGTPRGSRHGRRPLGRISGAPGAALTCRMTQWPCTAAMSSAFSATTSWPCPSDTLCSFSLSMVKPSFLPGADMHRGCWGCREWEPRCGRPWRCPGCRLTQGLHVFQGVDAGGEDEEDGGGRAALLVGLGELHAPAFHKLAPHLLLHKVPVPRSRRG